MSDQPLQQIIDGLRTRLQAELDAQLSAIAVSHDQAIVSARRAAAEEAEQHWAARLDSTQADWQSRLEEAMSAARADADRRLVAESLRIRLEAEQSASEAAGALRRDLEAAAAAEAAGIRRQLEASAAEEAARIRRELETSAIEEAARIRQEFDAAASENAARLRREIEAAAYESASQLRRELESTAAERADDLRRQLEQAVAEGRERAQAIAAERERAERALAQAQDALAAERQRNEDLLAQPRTAEGLTDGGRLLEAIGALDAASTLSEVLALTAAAAAAEAPRSAVFVANGPQLEEWVVPPVPALSSSAVRIDGAGAGVLGRAVAQAEPQTSAPDGPLAPAFAALPPHRIALAVPLTLGGQPVGVLYADEGPIGDVPPRWRDAVVLLGRHSSACLAHLTATRTAQAMRLISEQSNPASGPSSGTPIDDQAARRYARLLVSEIKLYNESAIRVGREKRDLLRRLKPEIERARRLYDERIPQSTPDRDACFDQALVQTLADGDSALLG